MLASSALLKDFRQEQGSVYVLMVDCICPGKGQYKILSRTFAYGDSGLDLYFNCELVP